MLIRITILTSIALVLIGCSRKPEPEPITMKPVGGPYYQELTVVPDKVPLFEPENGNRLRWIYTNADQTIEITSNLGLFADSIYRDFNYHIYGSNFVYVEWYTAHDGTKFRLRDFSPKNGNITVDEDFGRYWKVIADGHGITCHRYQDRQKRDDPNPVVYSAEYLSGL